MKKLMGNTLLKFIAALLCVALLMGAVWYGFWGVIVTIASPETVAREVLQMAMSYDTRSVLWYEDQLKQILESEEQDWSELGEYVQGSFDPALTNFRFRVIRDGEVVLSNYNDEPEVAKSVNWNEEFVGTDRDMQRIDAFERGWVYDDATDERLPERGNYRYEVESKYGLPKEYITYDEVGYLYDAEDNLVAYVENYAEVFEPGYDPNASFKVDGVTYYPVDPAEGFPEYFAYRNDYDKFFDENLNFITTLDDYYNEWVSATPSPRPTEIVESQTVPSTPNVNNNSAVKPVIRELDPVTEEEYNALKNEIYEQVVVNGYIVKSEAAVEDADGNPITEPRFAVEDKYSRLYDYMILMCAENGKDPETAVVFSAMAFVLMIFLIMSAGHRSTEEGDQIVLRMVERMPWDLWLCFVAAGAVSAFGGFYLGAVMLEPAMQENTEVLELVLLFWGIVAALTLAFMIWMLMSFAARVKVKGWWRSCLCWKLCVWLWKLCVKCLKWCWKLWLKLWRGCKALCGRFGGAVKKIPLVWKAAVVFLVVGAVEFIFFGMHSRYGEGVFLALMWHIVRFLVCIIICLMLKRLQEGARTIADGDLDYRIDTKNLYGDVKEHAECLNRIGEGLSHNVDARLRSERMKTELITNVSHDLKTPLTSIVNYVDLLKKEELTGNAAEYVEVLDRQSARLKKLTEDLVEASKASTGVLQVSMERVSLTELMEQAGAEYAHRLQENGLQPIVRVPDEEVTVWADGKYVWRILDNLLSNVCKYAMPNTRVYLEVRTEGEHAILSVKNMSRESLNISAEELMERFVRGDASRNTEGSGLGLSIAQSLAKLMGGEVRVTIDGDLFKAEVLLPLAK